MLKGHRHSINALDFSPDGRVLISGSDDRTVRIWNMRDGSSRILGNSSSFIRSIRFSPDRQHIAAGNTSGELFVWEPRSGHLVASLKGHYNSVESLVFMPNAQRLISGSWDKTLKCWEISKSTSVQNSDLKGLEVADDERLKERLTFVGHTVRSFISCPGLFVKIQVPGSSTRHFSVFRWPMDCFWLS